ncbi:MAG: response regulator [Chitinivibrionales bacterium]|nr:response regulator [Chitinivibrionales bacterium]
MIKETHTDFLGRTRTMKSAAAKSEQWVAWIRLVIGLFASIMFTLGFFVRNTGVPVYSVQMLTALALILYSFYYLFYYSHKQLPRSPAFVSVLFDVTIVTYVLWSYSVGTSSRMMVQSALFGAYFIPIAFAALHHQMRLSIFAGGLAAAEYSFLYFLYLFPATSSSPDWIYDYSIRISLLLIVAVLGGIISRNNFKAIEKMIKSETRYQNLVQRLPEMLFTLDVSGNFLWANRASYPILGVPEKVLEGRNIRDFFLNKDEFKLRSEGLRGTFEIKDFEGGRKFVDCTIRPLETVGNNQQWEGLMSDITDKELAMSQREEMANRLFQYQKMESLGTLASGMAHDFNNILQTVNDLIAQVQNNSNENATRQQMGLVLDTLQDAKFLTSELLALGRKRPLDYESINIRNFFEKSLPLFRKQLGDNYDIIVELTDEQLWIQGDANYLKRIFQNLIGNSRDAMPGGGKIFIECFATRAEGSANTVVIRFSDTGCGIPTEILENIFDPFFTTKKAGKGTGLGLALVKRIVSLHKGIITIEKTDSEGTIFRMEFPESEKEDLDLDTKQIMVNRLSSRILLLEDDAKIRDILKVFIKGLGYPFCEASNQEEALATLKRYRDECDVVIMDWKLGTDDPHKLIDNLRKIKQGIAVIVVSGYPPPKQKNLNALGIRKWFTKPYDKNMLDLEIQKALYRLEKSR